MRILMTAAILLAFLIITGCSGSGITPPSLPETESIEKHSESGHSLWGFWTIHFDPVSLKLEAEPQRNLEMHIDITDMILPPACDNCLEIIFNSFNTDTGILKFGIILRNEFPVTGHDVRGIIYTDDEGHLLMNADDWIGLHDIPGGQTINPFKGFYGLYGESEFGPGDARYSNFEVYIPDPPDFDSFNFAVDASYPGQCKEPYAITDFTYPPLYDVTGHAVIAEVTVSDWQDDVDKVTLVAPAITGESFTQFYPHEDIWRVQIANITGAGPGEYEARIIATSAGSGAQALHDYVTIEITEGTAPIVTGVYPSTADAGTSLVEVNITGAGFSDPVSEVVLSCDTGPDIAASNVEFISSHMLHVDIDIPLDASVGLYDIEVTDSLGITGIGEEFFEVLTPSPVVLGIDPASAKGKDSLENVTVTGLAFIGPGAQVKLKKDSAPDVEAYNVSVVDWETITCDIDLPLIPLGAWDVEVTNDDLKCGIGDGIFTLNCPEPVITSLDPKSHHADDTQFELTIHGNKFIDGVDLAVKLREGGQTNIDATNVTWVDANTLTCDVIIPSGTPKAYWDIEVTNGCGISNLKTDVFHVHNLSWAEPLIEIGDGYHTKVRDAVLPTISSYMTGTLFLLTGDTCTGAVGIPVYEYYPSTSNTEQVGDTWHEFTFAGYNYISIDWFNYTFLAPNEIYLWVRCVDGPDIAGPYVFTTPIQLSHQIWGDSAGFNTGWTHWGLSPDVNLWTSSIDIHNIDFPVPFTGYDGVHRNGTAFLTYGNNYSLESCATAYDWAAFTGCYIEPQIGETETLGTAIGDQFTYLDKFEPLIANFSAPSSASYHIGFYFVDAISNDLDSFSFYLDNICLYHDP